MSAIELTRCCITGPPSLWFLFFRWSVRIVGIPSQRERNRVTFLPTTRVLGDAAGKSAVMDLLSRTTRFRAKGEQPGMAHEHVFRSLASSTALVILILFGCAEIGAPLDTASRPRIQCQAGRAVSAAFNLRSHFRVSREKSFRVRKISSKTPCSCVVGVGGFKFSGVGDAKKTNIAAGQSRTI
jgi:hypothetical protein